MDNNNNGMGEIDKISVDNMGHGVQKQNYFTGRLAETKTDHGSETMSHSKFNRTIKIRCQITLKDGNSLGSTKKRERLTGRRKKLYSSRRE